MQCPISLSILHQLNQTACTKPINDQFTFAMIKPGSDYDAIEKIIQASELEIIFHQEANLSEEQIASFYSEHVGKDYFAELEGMMTSGPVHGYLLEGTDSVSTWRQIIGPTDPEIARKTDPSRYTLITQVYEVYLVRT